MRIPRGFRPLLLASFSIILFGSLYGCRHITSALHLSSRGPMTEVSAEYADKNVETLLAHMRNAYESVKAATYTTESVAYNAEGGKDSYNTEFAFKKPMMIRGML